MSTLEKINLVIGGTGGIGEKTVNILLNENRLVAFTYFKNKSAAEKMEKTSKGKAKGFFLNISEKNGPEKLVHTIEDSLGPITGLVNIAGKLSQSIIGFTKDKDWDEILDINLGGVFRVCKAVLPYMIHRKEGSIVNVSSLSAIHPLPGQSAYAASKAGILGLTRAIAKEVGKKGIRVNSVLPGFLETELTSEISPQQKAKLRTKECLPSGVDIDSVGDTIFFLLSNRSKSITGQAIIVDAGVSV